MPDAALMQRCLFFALFDGVVTGLAEGLQVGFIPEQALIATVRDDMVTDQQGGVAFELAAILGLACVEIAKEYAKPQPLPSGRLVPSLPW